VARLDVYLCDLRRLSVPAQKLTNLLFELIVGDVKASTTKVSNEELDMLALASRELMELTMTKVITPTVPITAVNM
jgi:hypothetical protein